ncbi:hypothetical protein QFC20_004732 [Naganishia adeliensis]|uniref:Uncharacterized protein n=1 Tax=Naganishia adeliensis TaxID=92952 RepID=A0ACC2VXQ0_9TREE|nr:hypothetical protein QFC20_004732 [Naganishia adeliensis]
MKLGSVLLLAVSQVTVSAWIGRPVMERAMAGVGSGGGRLDELDVTEHSSALSPRDHPSSSQCESELISRLKLTCHDTEADRIGVSIALTLCSITSARQQPPTECDAWSAIGFQTEGEGWKDMPGSDATDVDRRGRCLEALHRSPQDWSSYHGFHSNAMQLCHALQGKQQQEMARSIYANISQEKMELLTFLKTNEELRKNEEGKNQERFQERLEALGMVHETARQQHDTLASLIAGSASREDQAHARLLESIRELRSTGEGWWEEVRMQVQDQLDIDIVNARTVMNVQVVEMQRLLDTLLSEVAEKQYVEMRSLVTQHRSDQDFMWEREQARVAQLVGSIAQITDGVGDKLADMGLVISHHRESLNMASVRAHQLNPILEMALRQSQALHSMQLAEENATRRNLDLTDNINEKLAQTLEIAELSNIALEELKEEISRQSSMGVSFWRYLEFAGTCQSAFDYVASLRAKQLDPV